MPSDVDELIALFEEAEEAGEPTVPLDSTASNKVEVATRPPTPAPPSLREEPIEVVLEIPKLTPSIEEVIPNVVNKTPDKREGGAGVGGRVATSTLFDAVESKGTVGSPASWLSPSHPDSLFWCLYCIHFGYNDYQQVSRNYGIRLLEVKKKIGEWIQANQSRMKQTNYKITKASVQEVLSDCLTSQKETTMISLLAFLSYFNMNVLIMDQSQKLLMEFVGVVGVDNPTYLLQKDEYGKYKVKETQLTVDEIQKIKEKCILLDSYEKPLKSISNYKVDELEKLARKVGVFDEEKKYKKADLYLAVFEACSFPVHVKTKQNYRK